MITTILLLVLTAALMTIVYNSMCLILLLFKKDIWQEYFAFTDRGEAINVQHGEARAAFMNLFQWLMGQDEMWQDVMYEDMLFHHSVMILLESHSEASRACMAEYMAALQHRNRALDLLMEGDGRFGEASDQIALGMARLKNCAERRETMETLRIRLMVKAITFLFTQEVRQGNLSFFIRLMELFLPW